MNTDPIVIFSDSDALIGDIDYVFRDHLNFISSGSLPWIEDYLKHHRVKLLIADMDIKIDVRTEVLERLRELGGEEISFLFLVSEKMKLELERDFGDLNRFEVSADWLVKPFSRNALISSVDHLNG
ncbi:MAG TPA: hypothetical protein DCO79_13040 [Spirochaeta sp.]|nr:hypothetical protein [Spirochaeta sp.]